MWAHPRRRPTRLVLACGDGEYHGGARRYPGAISPACRPSPLKLRRGKMSEVAEALAAACVRTRGKRTRGHSRRGREMTQTGAWPGRHPALRQTVLMPGLSPIKVLV